MTGRAAAARTQGQSQRRPHRPPLEPGDRLVSDGLADGRQPPDAPVEALVLGLVVVLTTTFVETAGSRTRAGND